MRNHQLVIIGHRGAHGLAPENTIKAFEKALEYGVDMIETDIEQTKDHVLVLQHDFIYMPDGSKLWAKHYTYEELKRIKPDVITLEEGIEFINRRTRLMFDIKRGVDAKKTIKTLQTYLARGWQPQDFMFNSNNFEILQECHRALPEVERVVQTNWKGVLAARWARKLDTSYLLLDQRYLWWGYVAAVSKQYKLMTYTYPWPGEPWFRHHKARRWARFGLWGVITDYPDYYHKRRKHESHAASQR